MPEYLVGLDLGQAQDYTAVAVVQLVEVLTGEKSSYDGTPVYVIHHRVRHLERFRLGTPYPAVVDRVQAMMRQEFLATDSELVVDATGVGTAVVDMLRERGLGPTAITITGGDKVSDDGDNYRVPKRDLVSVMQVLLQSERLKVAEGLPDAGLLVQELLNFRVKIDPLTAHDSYGAWREGQHDDLVLATAVACWYGEQGSPNFRWFNLVDEEESWQPL